MKLNKNSKPFWKIENDNDEVNQEIKEPENDSSDDDLPFQSDLIFAIKFFIESFILIFDKPSP